MINGNTLEELTNLENYINSKIKNMEDDYSKFSSERAYGGYIRSEKGKLVEYIAEKLVSIAWVNYLNQNLADLNIGKKKIKVPIDLDNLDILFSPEVIDYINKNSKKYFYNLSVDKHVFVKNKFVLAIECKAFTENAMIKRVLYDFSLLKKLYPELDCVLLQLESQLGGDFSKNLLNPIGSPSTNTILSFFKFKLQIITLLEGERKVDKEIHKFPKKIKLETLQNSLYLIGDILKKHI